MTQEDMIGAHQLLLELEAKARDRTKEISERKVDCLNDEIHKKVTLVLVKSYKAIMLPKFETSQMVKKAQRKIRSKTARGMLTWAHYRFQQRLIDKTREYRQCKVVIVDESFTSKTCGACGHTHKKLGGNKVFKCPQCGTCLDRDVNGARNVLKFLTDFPTPKRTGNLCIESYFHPKGCMIASL